MGKTKKVAKVKLHTLHVRNVPEELYQRLWNMRKAYKARSWTDLLDQITKEYIEEIESYEWL